MEDVEEVSVCITLNEQTKTKSVSQGVKKRRKNSVWVKPWRENQRQTSTIGSIFAERDKEEFTEYHGRNP